MTATEKFRNFLTRRAFRKAVNRNIASIGMLPSCIQRDIQQEWSSCFAFRGEEDWDNMCYESAKRICDKHKWLSNQEYLIASFISNY